MASCLVAGWRLRAAASLLMIAGCPAGAGGTTEDASATAATSTGAEVSTSSGDVTTGDATTGAATTGDATTGGTTGEGESSGTASTTETTGTTGEPVCPCILDEQDEGWGQGPSLPICGEELCPTVHAEGWENDLEGLVIDDPKILECMLTALRDRTPGLLTWNWSRNAGQYSMFGYLLIQADGTVTRRYWGPQDLDYVVDDARSSALPEPATFSQCLADESDEARFDCAVSFPIVAPVVVCDEGWINYEYGW